MKFVLRQSAAEEVVILVANHHPLELEIGVGRVGSGGEVGIHLVTHWFSFHCLRAKEKGKALGYALSFTLYF
jgi:hypothetical protein